MEGARPSFWIVVCIAVAGSSGCARPDAPAVSARDRPVYMSERRDDGSPRARPSPRSTEDGAAGLLTLERALALAEAGNPGLLALERQVAEARGRETQAGLWPNPTFGASSVEGPLYGGPRRSINNLGLEYPFPVGGRIEAALAAAGAAREQAEQELAVARLSLRAEVRTTFAIGLAQGARLSLTRDLAALARRSQAIAEARFRAGDAPESEVLKAEIELERIELERASTASNVSGTALRLATLLGRPDAPIGALAGALPTATADVSLDDLKARTLREYPRVLALDRAWEAARFELLLARRQRIPDLTVSVAGGTSLETRATNDAILELGVSVPVPLFDRNQGRIAEAEARVGRAAREAEAGVNEVLLELADAHRRFTIARERVKRYGEEILPRAARALDQARAGYQAGKIRFLEVLDSQRTLGEARGLSIDALGDLAAARAVLGKFIGE